MEPLTPGDAAAVSAQLGRPSRGAIGVGQRCACGLPCVVVTRPRLADGTPFPTTYYLTCPHLVAAVSRVEAAGGVERWSETVEQDPDLASSLEDATEKQCAIRRELVAGRADSDGGASLELGIGGSRNPRRLKCLHAHVAFALANPGYELGERIVAELPHPLWPSECCTP